jgi:hypothetical protein
MLQPQQNKPTQIPIDVGTVPDWETRLGYPQLLNLFVGENKHLYPTPFLSKFSPNAPDKNARAIHRTTFDNGSYIVVTQNVVLKIDFNGQYKIIAKITNSGLPVQIDENLQNQIGIVDGRNFWVYDQNNGSFLLIGETQGFQFKTPMSIVVLNTVAIILDEETNSWAISEVNNMISWPVLDNVPQISSQLTQAVSLETLSDNLYIFGSTGIERWVPNSGNNPYLFPFAKDTNYRQDFGAIGTNSVVRGFSEIYFLSSKFVPMSLTSSGLKELGEPKPSTGMAKIISQYVDVDRCEGSFYSYKGYYFYSMTFPLSSTNWTYCKNSNTWLFNDDLIISALETGEVVANSNGLFNIELTPQIPKKRQWRSERLLIYKGTEPYRALLNACEPKIIQGNLQSIEPEYLELQISIDSLSWLNTLRRQIGLTGQRNARNVWNLNLAALEFTFQLTYQGILDFVIERFDAIIK